MNQLSPQTALFDNIASLIEQARQRVRTAVNTAMVYTYYEIGRHIVEHEQKGENRAEYGKAVLKELSARLTERFGDGWSYAQLNNVRQFYLVYTAKQVPHQFQDEFSKHCLENSSKRGNHRLTILQSATTKTFTLSWSHYLVLIRVKDAAARSFYEIECAEQNWSVRQLQRQVNSSLYERLALSRNKDEVLRLANEGQSINKPADLKTDKLTHQDLGQMQMYVNYFDRYVRQPFEKPTIGILLCKEKNHALVELTLPEEANIYASSYELYLPDKALLQAKVHEWIADFEASEKNENS